MEVTLRQEEIQFVEFLKEIKDLNNACGNVAACCTEKATYRTLVATMVNSYGFHAQQVIDAICANPTARKNFIVLALHYVMQCAERYSPEYWDKRDEASVKACNRIVSLSSFKKLYGDKCAEEYLRDYGLCPCRYTTHAVALTGVLSNMHSTNRQTFCGMVLTFLLSQNNALKKQILAQEILSSDHVRFLMI